MWPAQKHRARGRSYKDASNPCPPTGTVSMWWSNPAISGRAFAIACCTAGSESEAVWLAASVQTSVIQIASASQDREQGVALAGRGAHLADQSVHGMSSWKLRAL